MDKDYRLEKDSDRFRPRNMEQQSRDGIGVYGSYNAFAEGKSDTEIEFHAIVETNYALDYASNILAHLERRGIAATGRVLDVGCAIGTVTGALEKRLKGRFEVTGIDISETAVGVARKTYPDCDFQVGSADDLSSVLDGSLHLIHAREFYPFSRSAAIDLHLAFLETFAKKLAPGGLIAVVQIVEKDGLNSTFPDLQIRCHELGMSKSFRDVVVPLRAYRRAGSLVQRPLVYPMISIAGTLFEAIVSGKVTFIYGFKKDG